MTTVSMTEYRRETPAALHRVSRGAIVVTALGVVFSLLVLLQLLPGTGAADDAGRLGGSTTALFVGGAVAAVLAIGAALIRATGRPAL